MTSKKFLERTCLKQHYSLRRQLLTSFGSAAFITLSLVVIVSIIILSAAGNLVKERSSKVMKQQINSRITASTITAAETFDKSKEIYDGVVQQVVELTLDRIVGYPEEGWEKDLYVPFFDMDTKTNVYPLKNEPVPLDWKIKLDVTDDNFAHVFPQRNATKWLGLAKQVVSHSTGSFFVQGLCDPQVSNPNLITYYRNCSDANNNMATGGAVKPTSTAKGLYEKSGDLAALFKPLHEAHPDIFNMGVHFYNSGAGASVFYPGVIFNGLDVGYVSGGCEWLRELKTINTTDEEIARCHPKGTKVPGREYNSVEREFFRDAVVNRGIINWYGPFKQPGSDVPLMTVSKAIFDRRTDALIGVAFVQIAVHDLDDNLVSMRLYDHSEWAILDVHTGRVYADSLHSTSDANTSLENNIDIFWWDLGILSESQFEDILNEYDALFETEWTPETLASTVEKSVKPCWYGYCTAYPLAVPPQKFDMAYRNLFYALAVHVVSKDVYAPIEDFESSVNNDVLTTSFVAALIGLFGMAVILLMLWCVALVLTHPLQWMEQVSWRIVNHGDKRSGDDLPLENNHVPSAFVNLVPKTEVTELVEEFRFMITGFSGNGASVVAESDPNEIPNNLAWQSEFRQLYTADHKRKSVQVNGAIDDIKRKQEDMDHILNRGENVPSSITTQTPSTENEDSCSGPLPENCNENMAVWRDLEAVPMKDESVEFPHLSAIAVFPAPLKKHQGPIAITSSEESLPIAHRFEKSVYRSRLFCWIVLLILIPLLLTNSFITVIVTRSIIYTVPAWVDDLNNASVALEMIALGSTVRSKALQISMILREPVHNLYWAARLAGWLHFGAMPRAASFTEVSTTSEQCKSFESFQCDLYDPDVLQCPCAWNDDYFKNTRSCSVMNRLEARSRQTRFFGVLAQDIDPITGNRTSAASFPEEAFSPETTKWQTNISDLPGAQKGARAAGFETTYDRLRVSSALAVVQMPLYNYKDAARFKRNTIGIYLGFEADGMFTGFSGCANIDSTFARFPSNEGTKAFEISPELCPKGKFGFDPRCRDWYSTTRRNFEQFGRSLFLTAPYVFGDESVGLSAAIPVADPLKGDFLGVFLLDYPHTVLQNAFKSLKYPLSFLITPDVNVDGGDIVVASNKKWEPSLLLINEIFPDQKDPGRLQFEENILHPMKMGDHREPESFERLRNGNREILEVAYAPVKTTIITPLNPGSLDSGVNATEKTLYSLAVFNSDRAIRQPFTEVETKMYSDLDRLALIDGVLIFCLSIIFFVVACKITVHVTIPMIMLLSTVRKINSREGRRELPPLAGGSREVHQVFNSFSKLYKIVRISNAAFFSGNLTWANQIVNDAIQLFRKIKDWKAIGIACNNLGNILFARELRLCTHTDSSIDRGFGKRAISHFDEAIEISQREFDRTDSISTKASFAQELADRLFNRGLLLLVVASDSNEQQETGIREKALNDILKARDLDYDVKEYYIENKLLRQFSADCFGRMLRRIHGLCSHYADEALIKIWDPSRLVEEADELLFAAWNEKTGPLFREVNRIGRLQQLEGAAIRLELCKGNRFEAARIAMRMFAEDEYLLEGPFSLASSALLQFVQCADAWAWSPKTLTAVRSGVGKMARLCRSQFLALGKCVVFVAELNERLERDTIFPLIHSKCMALFENHCTNDDYVGVAAYTIKGDQTLKLSRKSENESLQRRVLDNATSSTSERVCSAFPFAMQLVLDSPVSQEIDTYILFLTDGYSWDPEPYASIKWQIARMNKENESNIHLIVLGVDVEEEHLEECNALCSVSQESFFVELTAENIDETFDSIASMFSGGRLFHHFMNAITMQKF